MAPPRTFDYDLLKQLVREHPDWSYHQYAQALTEAERVRLSDPRYPAVMPNTIAAAVARNRDRWIEEGIKIPDRRAPVYDDMIPWRHIPEQHRMHTHLRKLRVLARLDRGLYVEPRDARLARQWEAVLRERKQVVDLSPSKRPILRPAREDELDEKGLLRSIVALPADGGGNSGQEQELLARLEAAEREVAALKAAVGKGKPNGRRAAGRDRKTAC